MHVRRRHVHRRAAGLYPDDLAVAADHKYLTGHLDAYVTAYPAFPGTEADYLRALVGRIAAHGGCPAGYFKMNEDGAVEKDEEHGRQALPSSWISPTGPTGTRTSRNRAGASSTHPRLQTWRDGEEPPEEPEPETSPELLSTLDLDADSARGGLGSGGSGARRGRGRGSDDGGTPGVATCTSSNVPGVQYQVVCAKSLVWPGAAVVCIRRGSLPTATWGTGSTGKVCPAAAAARGGGV